MRYENLIRFNDAEFKRLVGVPRPLFEQMVSILEEAERSKKKSGRPHTLTIEDQLLLTFNYLRSYSTQIELAATYGIAESNVNRMIQKIETALVRSRQFALLKRDAKIKELDFVIVDVTESKVERPKKTNKLL